jgi:5-formyltetrahydrofolate cyclo-ligase
MKPVYLPGEGQMKLACMLSGSGTIVRRIIERQLKLGGNSPFKVVAIFTDRKDSNAMQIAAEYAIPFLCNDIKEYYATRKASRKDLKIRAEYDYETASFIRQHKADAIALCGYMSITTPEIFNNFCTVNVHPADLRKKDSTGKRIYAGMMGIPSVEAAIMNGDKELRSTVHLVNSSVDGGPILMVSGPVRVEITASELKSHELMLKAAERNMNSLKEKGDWIVYPEAVEMLASGRFSIEGNDVYVDGVKKPDGYCPSDEKEAIRILMREQRKHISGIAEKSAAILENFYSLPEFRHAKRIMLYCALPHEVQADGAIKESSGIGKKIMLPIMKDGHMSVRYFTGFDKMKKGAHGILEPTSNDSVKERIDLVVMPGLAFDAMGTRIGFGLGCYDEFLKLTSGKRIGFCFESQLLDSLPREGKDVPMDIVITEKRVLRIEEEILAKN